jgi:hypothetical protein
VPGSRKNNPELDTFPPEECVGNLYQQSRTVTRALIGTSSAAVHEVFKNLNTAYNDTVASMAIAAGNESNTTGIVFILRII